MSSHKVCLAFIIIIIIKGTVTSTSYTLPCLDFLYHCNNETQYTFSKWNKALKHQCVEKSPCYVDFFGSILFKKIFWLNFGVVNFNCKCFFFLLHLHLWGLQTNVAPVFSSPWDASMPILLAAGFPRLLQRDPCHNKARGRLSLSFNAKTQSECVKNTLRLNKEYFCSCPFPPSYHKHGDSTQELEQSFFKSNVCFCTGNTLVIRGRGGGQSKFGNNISNAPHFQSGSKYGKVWEERESLI